MTANISGQLLYREVQQFRQFWLWLVVLGSSATLLYAASLPFLLKVAFKEMPVQQSILIAFGLLFGLGLPVIFYPAKLITEVYGDGVYISFFPFLFAVEKIALPDIASYEVLIYKPLKDYGGWGIRYSAKGKAFNVSGNRGVLLQLVKGEKVLIGSQNPESFAKAIELAILATYR